MTIAIATASAKTTSEQQSAIMSLARSSTAFDTSPNDPDFFDREKERLIAEISTVSQHRHLWRGLS
jgi:hypothetical protein